MYEDLFGFESLEKLERSSEEYRKRNEILAKLVEDLSRPCGSLEEYYQAMVDALNVAVEGSTVHLCQLATDDFSIVRVAKSGEIYDTETIRRLANDRPLSAEVGRFRFVMKHRRPILMRFDSPHVKDMVPEYAVKAGRRFSITTPLLGQHEFFRGFLTFVFNDDVSFVQEDEQFFMQIGRIACAFLDIASDMRKTVTLNLERDRRRIAYEFKDETSTLVSTVAIKAASARSCLDEGDVVGARRALDRLETLSIDVIRRVRDQAMSLCIGNSQDEGDLVTRIRTSLKSFEELWNIETRFECNEPEVISSVAPTVTHHLMRIFNDAMSNTARHSKATNVVVRIQVERSTLSLLIEDDGRGFCVGDPESEGLGIREMRERAAILSSELTITSSPAGTAVCVDIPERIWMTSL